MPQRQTRLATSPRIGVKAPVGTVNTTPTARSAAHRPTMTRAVVYPAGRWDEGVIAGSSTPIVVAYRREW